MPIQRCLVPRRQSIPVRQKKAVGLPNFTQVASLARLRGPERGFGYLQYACGGAPRSDGSQGTRGEGAGRVPRAEEGRVFGSGGGGVGGRGPAGPFVEEDGGPGAGRCQQPAAAVGPILGDRVKEPGTEAGAAHCGAHGQFVVPDWRPW